MQLLDEHTRELLGMPKDWEGYEFESYDGKLLKVTGAVAPLKTKGKNKGERNWAKLDKTTIKTVYFTPDEHSKWMDEWEINTGKCSHCEGSGLVLVSWNIKTGKVMAACEKCNGSGKLI